MAYYVVYFAGDALNAFSDWFSGGRSIQSGVPYVNKSDAITASLGRARACIVYNGETQTIAYSHDGYVSQSVQELLVWAKTNIRWTPSQIIDKQVIDKQDNEILVPIKKDWAYSKSKKMHHTVEVTEFHLAVDNLSKLIAATVAGMVGNVPGILQAVSGLTIDICSSSEDKEEKEAFIKDITDNDGNKGVLVLKASSETKIKKKFWGKNEKKMNVSGIIYVLVPLSEKARQQCIEIENKHATNVLEQIEKTFLMDE
jgi:hypothetical protein